MSKRKSGSSKTKKKGPSKNSREKEKEEAELVEEAEEEEEEEQEEDSDYFYTSDNKGRCVRFNLEGIDSDTREKAAGGDYDYKCAIYCQRPELALWVDIEKWDRYKKKNKISQRIPKGIVVSDK